MAVVLHTTKGDLPLALHARDCPRAAFNFLALCAAGTYGHCAFYRHIRGVLLQSGDPSNTGKGGESIYSKVPSSSTSAGNKGAMEGLSELIAVGPTRFFDDEGFGVTHHNRRGVLSMAHKGNKPNTNASQFFVLCESQPGFDGVYTAFGEVLLDTWYRPINNTDVADDADALLRQVLVPAVKGEDGFEKRGEAVLQALEEAAVVDEKNIVLDQDAVRITGATVLYNPFAEGRLRL